MLIKKEGDGAKNITGCWDSIHVIEITERVGSKTVEEFFFLIYNFPGTPGSLQAHLHYHAVAADKQKLQRCDEPRWLPYKTGFGFEL